MEQIGEGGFGLVFVAEQQQPVRRKVALKIIKPGMDSKQVIARFEAERQALALMDHQHIAKVFDAGTTESGRPYFVMELVHGVPITEYCDANKLTPRERLELFMPVCHAIQHAHQKGIIHRDIKPSNVLVTLVRLGNLTHRHLLSAKDAEPIILQAWELAREVLGPDHLSTLVAMRNMAILHIDQGRIQEGEDLFEQFRADCVRTRGEADTWSMTALVFLAYHYGVQGKMDRAEEYATRAVELRRKHQGVDHYLTLMAEDALAITHVSQDRFDEAEALYRHIAKGRSHHLGENSFGELHARTMLGWTLMQQGKHEEAVAVLREVVPLLRHRQPDFLVPSLLGTSVTALGNSLNQLARFAEAEPMLREALKIREKAFGGSKSQYHNSQSILGETLTGLKRFKDAEEQLLAARKGLSTPESNPLNERWRLRLEPATLKRLVQLYGAWGKPDEAAKWRKELEARQEAETKL